MPEFDVVIKGGMVVDGTRLPRYDADVAVKDGRIAYIGKVRSGDAKEVLDASGQIVAPGVVDLHTHLDGQIFWDPYCTTAGWHGVTSVVLGNCGFGFAPVAPEMRDRAMQMMSRNEQIPFESLKAGMPWDWVTFPEFMDSVERTPKGVNALCFVPLSPLMAWVMGLAEAKSGREATVDETKELQRLLREAMQAGACGWSAQRGGAKSMQADFDGTPFPTDVMSDELCIAMAEVLAEFDNGAIQISPLFNIGDFGDLGDLVSAFGDSQKFSEVLAEISGRPIIHNLIAPTPDPSGHREQLRWLEECHARGNRVIGQGATVRAMLKFTLENNQTFDSSDVWRSVLVGPRDEQLARLRDPAVVDAMVADVARAGFVVRGNFGTLTVSDVGDHPDHAHYVGRSLADVAAERGEEPVAAMIRLSAETGFGAEFETGYLIGDADGVADLMRSPHVVPGPSDGGAHMKMTVGGNFGTDLLTWVVRDEGKLTLEEAHWHLSHLSAQVAGFRDRGSIQEGLAADLMIYDLDALRIVPEGTFEKAFDMPAGEWRRVQRAEGIRYTMVNGVVTFLDGKCTDATPGKLLRHGRA